MFNIICHEWHFFYYLDTHDVIQDVEQLVHAAVFRAALPTVPQYVDAEHPRCYDADDTHASNGFIVLMNEMSYDKQRHHEHKVDETLYEKLRCLAHLPAVAIDNVGDKP